MGRGPPDQRRSSTPIVMIPSSAIASWPTRSVTPASAFASARCGGSARPTAGGRSSARRRPRRSAKVVTAAHDDLVRRVFHADAPNQLWLTDITEHPTAWIPAVVATVGLCQTLVKQRVVRPGVSQSRALRGRPLSSSATCRSSSALCGTRSVPAGSTGEADRWCSRCCRAAKVRRGRRSRPACRWRR